MTSENPYQAPQVGDAVLDPSNPEYVFTARYRSDDAQIQLARSHYLRSFHIVLAVGILACSAAIATTFLFSVKMSFAITCGYVAIYVVGISSTLAKYVILRYSIKRSGNHPVLGADGERVVTISADSLTVKSTTGQITWPLTQVVFRYNGRNYLVLEHQRFLIEIIPVSAEVDPAPFNIFRRAVRRRSIRRFFTTFRLWR